MQGIPAQLYEAAEIDGAGPFRKFWNVTLPSLRPQIAFLTIMGTIGAIQVFEQIYMLGGGSGNSESKFGPEDCGMTMVPYIYRKGFEEFLMGEASAIAYVLFAFILLLTMINWRIMIQRREAV
ncbi:sugar ABC transporter permease [bacterium]|nr:sugar ABC transporter permease [bacterium]